MKKRPRLKISFRLLLFVAFTFLPTLFCSSRWEDQAIKLAKEIPVYPDATYIGEFITSYPSSLPGAGITYRSTSSREEILSFYMEQLPNSDWEIIKVDADSSYQSVPFIIESQRDNWLCQVIIESQDQIQITINITTK
jgi:hypothetical protein